MFSVFANYATNIIGNVATSIEVLKDKINDQLEKQKNEEKIIDPEDSQMVMDDDEDVTVVFDNSSTSFISTPSQRFIIPELDVSQLSQIGNSTLAYSTSLIGSVTTNIRQLKEKINMNLEKEKQKREGESFMETPANGMEVDSFDQSVVVPTPGETSMININEISAIGNNDSFHFQPYFSQETVESSAEPRRASTPIDILVANKTASMGTRREETFGWNEEPTPTAPITNIKSTLQGLFEPPTGTTSQHAECQQCSQQVNVEDVPSVVKHLEGHWPDALVYQCPACDYNHKSLRQTTVHVHNSHPLVPPRKAKRHNSRVLLHWNLMLEHCFPKNPELKEQVTTHYEEQSEESKKKSKVVKLTQEEQKRACKECSYLLTADSPKLVMCHVFTHLEQKPFACSECGQRGSYSCGVLKHIRVFHPDGNAVVRDKRTPEMERLWREKLKECFPEQYDKCKSAFQDAQNAKRKRLLLVGREEDCSRVKAPRLSTNSSDRRMIQVHL